MLLAHTPKFISWFYFNRVWTLPNKEKKIYLTFDDGPVPETTPWVLRTLRKYNAKATFFCVGNNVEKHPKLFDQILQEGHTVGNHTFNHSKGLYCDTDTYVEDVMKAQKLIRSNLFRPPHGRMKYKQSQALKNKFHIVMWDVLSVDYDPEVSPQQCVRNVLDNVQEGSVIVFHDSIKAAKNMKYALKIVLRHLSREGYQFEAIKKPNKEACVWIQEPEQIKVAV